MSKLQKDFFIALDEFIKEFNADGTIARWERQRKMTEVERSRRKLNRRIKETKVILGCLQGVRP
jgi:hypothetical protein